MEIRMFRFIIILLLYQHNLRNSYVVKYFIFQAFSSVVLILSLCKGLIFNDILLLVTIIKLGAAPFHRWFMRIVEKISLRHFFWMAVPQKIIPLRLIQAISLPRSRFNKVLLVRVVLACVHMITQLKFIKILAASSIYITPWILCRFFVSDLIRWIFFATYSIIQARLLILVFKIKTKSDPLNNRHGSVGYYRVLLLVLLIAGFPPSPLFFIKLRILLYLFLAKFRISAIALMLIARISIFTYLNIVRIRVTIRFRQQRLRL
jgi:NADH-ubiquinone oxidoreductase chain 2